MRRLYRSYKRRVILLLTLAAVAGAAAWQLSGTAQAHRTDAMAAHAASSKRRIIGPSGGVRGMECLLSRAATGGRRAQIAPIPDLRGECWALPCAEPIAGVGEVFGGTYREAEPVRPLFRCESRGLPPGYASPPDR